MTPNPNRDCTLLLIQLKQSSQITRLWPSVCYLRALIHESLDALRGPLLDSTQIQEQSDFFIICLAIVFLSNNRATCRVLVRIKRRCKGGLQGRPESCLPQSRHRNNRTDRAKANRSDSASFLHAPSRRDELAGAGSGFQCI